MKRKRILTKLLVVLAVLALTAGSAWGASTCVTCHMDEDMLVKTLTPVKAAKSAKQSGAG